MSNISTNALAPSIAATGLKVNVEAGSYYYNGVLTIVPATTVTLADNNTNYVVLTPSTGVLSSNTSGFTSVLFPIAKVVTKAKVITSLIDSRPDFLIGTSLSAGVTSLASANATITVSAATGAVDVEVPDLPLLHVGTLGVGTGTQTAMTSPVNTAGSQPGPVSPQAVVNWQEIKIGGVVYWIPLAQ